MKIGILTYHRAHNYGAMLQAYALRTYLQHQGHEVDFIDYWPTEHANEYRWLRTINGETLAQRMVNTLAACLTGIRRWMRMKRFAYFRKTYLGLPDQAQYTQYGARIEETYDCVIVGSDQIWRNHRTTLEYLGFDPVYFCRTLSHSARCISYAASMGVIRTTEEEDKTLRQYMSSFETITVREASLQQKLAQLGVESTVVCDPTLLLRKEEWNSLLPEKRFSEKPYVLYYEMLPYAQARHYAQKMAQERSCTLLVIPAVIHTRWHKEEQVNIGPLDLIHAIRDAEFVVSTSFHGTAFSVIFEKQFVSMGAQTNSDRILTLLSQLQIQDHYTTNEPEQLTPIDYTRTRVLKDAYVRLSEAILQ